MKIIASISFLIAFFTSCNNPVSKDISTTQVPETTISGKSDGLEKATFGGGCFWCVEAVFEQLKGVEKVTSGYAGGTTENPNYKSISKGNTGHAEVVQILFDPEIIPYEVLLEVFWVVHDPTQLNRQGNDIGTQYRSIILYENEQQKQLAEKSIKKFEASDMYQGDFTTQLVPLDRFYTAEEYHQNYYENNMEAPYCTNVILPKIEKFQKIFADRLKE